MATNKPRITITLEPEEHEALMRLAVLQQRPMSAIIRELIGEVSPIFARVVEALELAQRASSDLRANFVKAASDAELELRPIADAVRSQFDMFATEIERAVDAAKSGDRTVSAPAETSRDPDLASGPQPVITGATDSQRAPSRAKKKTRREPLKSASKGGK